MTTFVIAEIGINHNGDINIAKRLIDAAVSAGCNAVKFQKRTVDIVYTQAELERLRESPFGSTNGDLKRGLEFGFNQYCEIGEYCKREGIQWFASCWDIASVDFVAQFNPPYFKIASASLTNDALLRHTRETGKPIILSTGMSTIEQVDHAVEVLGKDRLTLLHTCSAYPSAYEDLNLRTIQTLQDRYGVPVGYSGHEEGTVASIAAVAMGACMVERHITLDRKMWGTDQAASLEPDELTQLVRDVRLIEKAIGDGVKRITESEVPVMRKLRQ